MTAATIRLATFADLPAINDIYNIQVVGFKFGRRLDVVFLQLMLNVG